MKITNNSIEEIITVLNDKNSFRNNINIKIPAKIRYAIRLNEERISELYNAYVKERAEMLSDYAKKGFIIAEDDKLKVVPEHMDEINKELTDLATIESEVSLQMVDKEEMQKFLADVDLSVPEEKVLLMFAE